MLFALVALVALVVLLWDTRVICIICVSCMADWQLEKSENMPKLTKSEKALRVKNSPSLQYIG